MDFLKIGSRVIRIEAIDFVELSTKQTGGDGVQVEIGVTLTFRSGASLLFAGEDAEALRTYFTSPSSSIDPLLRAYLSRQTDS